MRKRGWNRTEEQGSSLWKDAFLRLSRNRAAMFSLLALALIAAACFLGPLLPWLPHPNVQDLSRIAESPSWDHWFGTDQLGRDLLARVLYGGRISLLVGVVATGVSLVIGVAYGLVSGYAGGRLDALMMRLVDVLFALPFIVLVIIFSLSVEEPARRLTQWVSGMTGWSVEMVSPMTGLIPLFIAIGALGLADAGAYCPDADDGAERAGVCGSCPFPGHRPHEDSVPPYCSEFVRGRHRVHDAGRSRHHAAGSRPVLSGAGREGSQFLMGNADQGRGGPHGGKSGIAFVPGAPVFGYPAGAEFPGGRPAGRPWIPSPPRTDVFK